MRKRRPLSDRQLKKLLWWCDPPAVRLMDRSFVGGFAGVVIFALSGWSVLLGFVIGALAVALVGSFLPRRDKTMDEDSGTGSGGS